MRIKKTESRARYFVRHIAVEKGWDARNLQRGGNVLEKTRV